jgi:glutaredoxin
MIGTVLLSTLLCLAKGFITHRSAAADQHAQLRLLSMEANIKLYGPAPRKFYAEPSKILDLAGSAVQFALRAGSGAFVNGYKVELVDDDSTKYSFVRAFGKRIKESGQGLIKNSAQPIELYEFEGCPYCRKVREAVSILDIDVVFYPCPRGGPNFRLKANKMGGKKQFPFMVDPNTRKQMYESDAIIKYLFDTYSVSIAANMIIKIITTIASVLFTTILVYPILSALFFCF